MADGRIWQGSRAEFGRIIIYIRPKSDLLTSDKKKPPFQECFCGLPSESSVGILGAVGREGRNSRLSHYHETSGLAQTRGESVNT